MGNTNSERGHGGGHGERHRRDSEKAKEEHHSNILMDSSEDADLFHADDPKVRVKCCFTCSFLYHRLLLTLLFLYNLLSPVGYYCLYRQTGPVSYYCINYCLVNFEQLMICYREKRLKWNGLKVSGPQECISSASVNVIILTGSWGSGVSRLATRSGVRHQMPFTKSANNVPMDWRRTGGLPVWFI